MRKFFSYATLLVATLCAIVLGFDLAANKAWAALALAVGFLCLLGWLVDWIDRRAAREFEEAQQALYRSWSQRDRVSSFVLALLCLFAGRDAGAATAVINGLTYNLERCIYDGRLVMYTTDFKVFSARRQR